MYITERGTVRHDQYNDGVWYAPVETVVLNSHYDELLFSVRHRLPAAQAQVQRRRLAIGNVRSLSAYMRALSSRRMSRSDRWLLCDEASLSRLRLSELSDAELRQDLRGLRECEDVGFDETRSVERKGIRDRERRQSHRPR